MTATFIDPYRFAASFSPSDITGLAGWWKADAITGLVDGDPVTSWPDSSAGARNMTQATSAKKPIYKTAIANGQPVVRFDGVDDLLLTASVVTATTTNVTLVLVVKQSSTTGTSCTPLQNGNGGIGGGGYGIAVDSDTNKKGMLRGGVAWDNSTTNEDTSWDVLVLSRGATNWRLWSKGTLLAPDPLTVGNPNVPATQTLMGIHDAAGGGNKYLNGDIAEALIYSAAISDADRDALETHLGAKYGIVVV